MEQKRMSPWVGRVIALVIGLLVGAAVTALSQGPEKTRASPLTALLAQRAAYLNERDAALAKRSALLDEERASLNNTRAALDIRADALAAQFAPLDETTAWLAEEYNRLRRRFDALQEDPSGD